MQCNKNIELHQCFKTNHRNDVCRRWSGWSIRWVVNAGALFWFRKVCLHVQKLAENEEQDQPHSSRKPETGRHRPSVKKPQDSREKPWRNPPLSFSTTQSERFTGLKNSHSTSHWPELSGLNQTRGLGMKPQMCIQLCACVCLWAASQQWDKCWKCMRTGDCCFFKATVGNCKNTVYWWQLSLWKRLSKNGKGWLKKK